MHTKYRTSPRPQVRTVTREMDMASRSLSLCLLALACAFLCLMASGCSIGQPTKPASFYVLTPQASMVGVADVNTNIDAQKADIKKIIGVGPVKIPSYIDRPQMVLRSGHDVRITLDEFNRWGEPLADNIPRIVTDMVALHAGPNVSVVQYPSASNRHAHVWLTMNINRLDGAVGDSATIDTWWSIVSPEGTLLHTGRYRQTLAVGETYEELAQVESMLLWMATKAAMEYVEFTE